MEKRKKHIINEVAYFKKVSENMKRKIKIKERTGENHEPFNDDIYLDKSLEQIPMDEQFQNAKFLGWIEIMKNPNLQKAINKLSKDEQIFITYLLSQNYTQQELADKLKINPLCIIK